MNEEEKKKNDSIEEEKHIETQIEQENNEIVDEDNNDNKEGNTNENHKKEESTNLITFLPKNFFDDKEKHKIVFNTLKNSDKIEIEGAVNHNEPVLDGKKNDNNREITKESTFFEETTENERITETLNKDEVGDMIDDLRKRLEIKKRNLETSIPVEKPQNSEVKLEESFVDLINFNWKRKKI